MKADESNNVGCPCGRIRMKYTWPVSIVKFLCAIVLEITNKSMGENINRWHCGGVTWREGGVGPGNAPVSRAMTLVRWSGAKRSFGETQAPYTWAEKFESFERINSIRETNGNFDSCNSCKRLGTSRLHELHESKFPFVSRIEFIRSKLSNFSAHVYGVADWRGAAGRPYTQGRRREGPQ